MTSESNSLPAAACHGERRADHHHPGQQPRRGRLAPRHQAGARRHPALALRRDLRGHLHDLGLCLWLGGGGRSGLRQQEAALHLFALQQSHRADVRGSHGPARGRRGGARHGDGHGRGLRLARLSAARRRPRRRLRRALRLLPICAGRDPAALRGGDRLRRRPRSRAMAQCPVAQDPGGLRGDAVQPGLAHHRSAGGGEADPCRRREAHRRQCLRHAAAAAAAGAGRGHRRLFRDQAYRRPGPLFGRRDPRRQGLGRGAAAAVPAPYRPGLQPDQCLAAAEGAGDAGASRLAPLQQRA